ncbi:MAG TPA: radical SAM protein [bacterium]|nr:radical SAM protein [bacterium]
MKVCLISPPTSRVQDELFFPMGLVAIGTAAREGGFDIEILDLDLELRRQPELRHDFAAFEAYVRREARNREARVFGISSICSNYPYALEIGEWIRQERPDAKIVFGGPQPSSVAPATMEAYPSIDVIVVGEGEVGFLELLRSDWSPDSLSKILGICYRENGELRSTPPRPLLEDLDSLPIPDFSLVDLRAYKHGHVWPAMIEAGRGCPFRCNFCSTAEMWVRKYRVKSPQRIYREMEILNAEYGMGYFSLTHDNFTTSPVYNRKFCRWFLENNRKGFSWDASARTDTVTIDDLDLMHRAGCRGLFFGVDSGSPRIQDLIDKHLDLEEFKSILLEAVKLGIPVTTSFIVGFPEETVEELDATISLGLWSKYAGAREVQFHRLSPLASTKVYAKNSGNLRFSPVVSDMSIIIMSDFGLLRKINRHPSLFSSFFEIPMPAVPDIDMFCFSNFYHALVNDIGAPLYGYLKKRNVSPVGFYQGWYAQNRQTEYSRLLTKPYVLDTVVECF